MAEVAGSVSEIARFVNDQQQLFDQLRELVQKLAADIGDIDEAGRETTAAAQSAADQSTQSLGAANHAVSPRAVPLPGFRPRIGHPHFVPHRLQQNF